MPITCVPWGTVLLQVKKGTSTANVYTHSSCYMTDSVRRAPMAMAMEIEPDAALAADTFYGHLKLNW